MRDHQETHRVWVQESVFVKNSQGIRGALVDVYLFLQMGKLGSDQALRPFAVRAVGLGENDNLVASDSFVDGLFSRHGSSGGCCETRENGPKRPVIYTLEHGTS